MKRRLPKPRRRRTPRIDLDIPKEVPALTALGVPTCLHGVPPGGVRLLFEIPPGMTDRQARMVARVIRRQLERGGFRPRVGGIVSELPKGGDT